jgi:hypothetical protein
MRSRDRHRHFFAFSPTQLNKANGFTVPTAASRDHEAAAEAMSRGPRTAGNKKGRLGGSLQRPCAGLKIALLCKLYLPPQFRRFAPPRRKVRVKNAARSKEQNSCGDKDTP